MSRGRRYVVVARASSTVFTARSGKDCAPTTFEFELGGANGIAQQYRDNRLKRPGVVSVGSALQG